MDLNINSSTDILGFIAGTLTTISFLPQVIKTWKSRSADDVSLIMFILGVSLWCVYGLEIHSIPVIIANMITFILATTILILKLLYDRKSEGSSDKESNQDIRL